MPTQRPVTAQDVRVMTGLIDARRCLQAIHGVNYATRIQPWCELVRAAMRQTGKPTLSAVLHLCQETTDNIAHLWLMAAGVEVIAGDPGAPEAGAC